jgi:uracil-DNA glycosylase
VIKSLDLFSEEQLTSQDTEKVLDQLKKKAMECTACNLHSRRSNSVFGRGFMNKPLVAVVVEAPGAEDDEHAKLLVGPTGIMVTRMMKAMDLDPEKDAYYCSTVCCRPPDNRKPKPTEAASCRHFLQSQLRAVSPRVILTMGESATRALVKRKLPFDRLRAKWAEWEGIPVLPTFSASILVKKSGKELKKECWKDLQLVMRKLRQLDRLDRLQKKDT